MRKNQQTENGGYNQAERFSAYIIIREEIYGFASDRIKRLLTGEKMLDGMQSGEE